MGSSNERPNFITSQVVAIPYPGRGHVNQMMNFCKIIANKRSDFLITFILTEEWLGFLSSEPHPVDPGHNIRFLTIPNVIPSEKVRAKDFPGFIEAVLTKMEAPVEHLLDRLELPKPKVILYDSFLKWVLGVANRRVIPAASFWPMSATFFTVLSHFETLVQNGQLPANPLEHGEHRVTCIPGIPSIRVADFPREMLEGKFRRIIQDSREFVSLAAKAEYLLFTSVYELESQVIDSLKKELQCPIYAIGLSIPSFNINENSNIHSSWLDAQPRASVLYISQGSFLSASDEQLDEFVAGVRDSGIRFFWVARENSDRFRQEEVGGDSSNGLVVTWCDQLKVLSHPSIGGFWSHCGWNSTKEAAFSGLPVITSPIAWDQYTNSKQIVEDWKIGWRLKGDLQGGSLVKREEISRILKRFMDSECKEGKDMRRRAQEISEICRTASSECGSSELQIEAFIKDISKVQN